VRRFGEVFGEVFREVACAQNEPLFRLADNKLSYLIKQIIVYLVDRLLSDNI
jgi:hypothetical protein